MSLYKELQVNGKEMTSKSLYAPSFIGISAFGYFDGASSNGECGCGMVLFLNNDHFFILWMGRGICSNTRAELKILWGILSFASHIGINPLNIFGNSNVIVEWENKRFNLQVNDFALRCMHQFNFNIH